MKILNLEYKDFYTEITIKNQVLNYYKNLNFSHDNISIYKKQDDASLPVNNVISK